ncbi:MAG: hypothetical protein WDO74_22615 [Pseudomonadota bacterium]
MMNLKVSLVLGVVAIATAVACGSDDEPQVHGGGASGTAGNASTTPDAGESGAVTGGLGGSDQGNGGAGGSVDTDPTSAGAGGLSDDAGGSSGQAGGSVSGASSGGHAGAGTGGTAAGGHAGAGTGGTATGGHSGSGTGGTAGTGAACNSVVNDGTEVIPITKTGNLPTALGGTIAEGTYHLVGWDAYPGGDTSPGWKVTFVVTGETMQLVAMRGSTGLVQRYTFQIIPASNLLSGTCPLPSTQFSYSSTLTTVDFVNVELHRVEHYFKQ